MIAVISLVPITRLGKFIIVISVRSIQNSHDLHTHPAPRALHDVLPGLPALQDGTAALSPGTVANWGVLTPRCGRVLFLEV